MSLETLPEDIKSRLRSALTITTINQCVIELILNALDAKATAIATQLNVRTYRIQVVDNGDGISKSNLNLIASHYRTNRCHSLKDYQRRVKYHGYRGESLACMREICSKLSITSREINSNETYLKVFEGKVSNKANLVKFRPSEGTTVTLENVFYNLPVRRKRINPELDFDSLKQFLVALSVIYPNVSLTLRNDNTTKMLFKNQKCNTVTDSLISYCPELRKDSFLDMQFSKHKLRISGLMSKKLHSNGKLQFVYVNKRPVCCQRLQKLISHCLKSNKIAVSKKQNVYSIYAINIKCPYNDVNLSFENNNYLISFDQFDVIKNSIVNILATLSNEEKPAIVNVSSVKFANDDEKSYAELTEICNLSGFVQSKVTKQTNAVYLEGTETTGKSYQGFKNQSKKIEIESRKSPAHFDMNDERIKVGKDNEKQSGFFELEEGKLQHKIIESSNNNFNVFHKYTKSAATLKSMVNSQRFESNEDILEPILSKDPMEQTGKLEIMQKFLKSTQFRSIDIKHLREDAVDVKALYTNVKQPEKSSSGTVLNAKSIITRRPSIRNTRNSEINTSMVSSVLTQLNKDLQNEQELETSALNKTSKLIQTSFTETTTLHFNSKNTETDNKTNVYHINFNQLHLLGKGNLKLNLQLNKDNKLDVQFDLNQSKYFPSTARGEVPTYENEKPVTKPNISKETFKSVRDQVQVVECLNQSKYFTTAKDATKKSNNAMDLMNGNNLEEDSSYVVGNTSTNGVISATLSEEINLDSAKKSTFYNTSNLDQMPGDGQSFGDSQFFQLKNTIPEDYQIWTDSSKIDIDFISASHQDIFRPSCSKVTQNKDVVNSNAVCKNVIKRYSTDPIYRSRHSSDEPKKRLKTYLSYGASNSNESYKEFVEQLNETKGKVIENLSLNKNDTIFSSNLMKDFINTSTIDGQNNAIDVHNNNKEWYTQNHGEFFVHKKTGFTTYKNPSTVKIDFNLKYRNEDIPKGVSPIITRVDRCLYSLSQSKKNQLHSEILKSYEEELDTVKWGKYIQENDHKTFFAALYKSRAKRNPIQIPDISKKAIPKEMKKLFSSGQSKSFADDLFSHLEVIGQLDQKFILAFYKYNQLIFVFDQHAVHERIRLEELQQTYTNEDKSFKSILSKVIYKLNFTLTEIDFLMENQRKINNLGLYFTLIGNDYIRVDQIPTCLHNKLEKLTKSHEKDNHVIVMTLFEEILANLKSSRGSLQIIPKVMQNILNSEACRGAIKFGETLSTENCQKLLNDLGKCNLPFQCAHGRPTLMPLVELTDNYHTLLKI